MDMVTLGEKTDPRVKRTRELIERAFMELLTERGFEAIRVQDIAERATINRATFYTHFEDKYALLDTVLHAEFMRGIDARLKPGSPLSEVNVRTMAAAVFEMLDQLDGHCPPGDRPARPGIETALQREIARYLGDWLRRAAPVGVRDSAGVTSVASTMSWAIFGAALEWSRAGRRPPLEDAVTRLIATLVDGAGSIIAFAGRGQGQVG